MIFNQAIVLLLYITAMESLLEEFTTDFMILSKYILFCVCVCVCVRYDLHVGLSCFSDQWTCNEHSHCGSLLIWIATGEHFPFKVAFCNFESVKQLNFQLFFKMFQDFKAGFCQRWSRSRSQSGKSTFDRVKIKNCIHKLNDFGAAGIRTVPFL